MTFDPIHQFQIHELVSLFKIAGREIQFTNSAFYMLISVALTVLLMLVPTRGRRLVPTRLQSFAELIYEFVANMIRSTAGEEGMKFFPFVFSLFMFILISNVIGIIPYTFTVASQIIITASLALSVFCTVIAYGFYKNGFGFFKMFVPEGAPIFILPLITLIEVISFFARPVSHSVRLFANMLAGHMTLSVFAFGFHVDAAWQAPFAHGFACQITQRARDGRNYDPEKSDVVHVPYRGGGPALTDLLGGQVQVYFASTASSVEYIRVGKLRALAVTTATRSKALPNIPAMGEFIPGYEASAFYGFGARRQPAGRADSKRSSPRLIETARTATMDSSGAGDGSSTSRNSSGVLALAGPVATRARIDGSVFQNFGLGECDHR